MFKTKVTKNTKLPINKILTYDEMIKESGIYIPEIYPNSQIVIKRENNLMLFITAAGEVEQLNCDAWKKYKFTKATMSITIEFTSNGD